MEAFDAVKNSQGRSGIPTDATTIWALLGKRPGDNQQVTALAAASGLPWRPLRLGFRKVAEALPNLRHGGSLFSLSRETVAALAAGPFPDVVIAAGKRSAPAALWLKARSGGRTKLVHLGRTFAPVDWFDLVITTPQYRMRPRANVIENVFPLTAYDERPSDAPRDDLEALPRPRLLVVVGGDASPLAFDAAAARRLVADALARVRSSGGSLLVVTSPRTSKRAVAALRSALAGADAPIRLSVFGEGPNDYHAFRAAADAMLVTSDSVSMVAEAAIAGAPVSLFPLAERFDPRVAAVRALERLCGRRQGARAAFDTLVDRGFVTLPRDVDAFLRRLEREGLLNGGGAAHALAASEMANAAAQVRALAAAAVATDRRRFDASLSSSPAPACTARGSHPAPGVHSRPDAGFGRFS